MKILYLDLDTLRPDHLGCYGYPRATSPSIDRMAREGMRFANFYTPDAPCLPSRAAMMTGQFGIHNGVVNHGGVCADRLVDGDTRGFRDSMAFGGSLINVYRDAGLHTCYVGGFGERHSAYWYYAGFHEVHDTAKGGMESASGRSAGAPGCTCAPITTASISSPRKCSSISNPIRTSRTTWRGVVPRSAAKAPGGC